MCNWSGLFETSCNGKFVPLPKYDTMKLYSLIKHHAMKKYGGVEV
jgi:hypothetical protein